MPSVSSKAPGLLLELEDYERIAGVPWRPHYYPVRHRMKRIPAALRKQVLERDAYRCQICGDWHDLHVDHIVPESAGGETALDNLRALCKVCNLKKGTRQ